MQEHKLKVEVSNLAHNLGKLQINFREVLAYIDHPTEPHLALVVCKWNNANKRPYVCWRLNKEFGSFGNGYYAEEYWDAFDVMMTRAKEWFGLED